MAESKHGEDRDRSAPMVCIPSGRNRSISVKMGEVVKARNQLGFEVPIDYLPEWTFAVEANVSNTRRVQTHTGWNPRSHFAEGLRLTSEWLRSVSV